MNENHDKQPKPMREATASVTSDHSYDEIPTKEKDYNNNGSQNKESLHLSDSRQASKAAVADDVSVEVEKVEFDSFAARQAMRIAQRPCLHLIIGLIVSVAISVIGLIAGDFSVTVEAEGWSSRGTLLSERQSQLFLVKYFSEDIFYAKSQEEQGRVWDDLTNNVQKGVEILLEERLEEIEEKREEQERAQEEAAKNSEGGRRGRGLRLTSKADLGVHTAQERVLQTESTSSFSDALPTCEAEWYGSSKMFNQARLWPVWKARSGISALSADALFEICEAEEATQQELIENDLCFGCDGTSDNGCFRPYSIVLYARLTIDNGMSMSCSDLRNAWTPIRMDVEAEWKACVAELTATHNPDGNAIVLPDSCPPFFSPTFVDSNFFSSGIATYTSSVFATREANVDDLFSIVDDFERGGDVVLGAYDTQAESLGTKTYEESLSRDMIIAMSSAIIIAVAMLVHTRSPFITFIGVLQVVLSFPVAFFVFKLVLRFSFFPFLNFIGVFVIFAIGADDVFVAFDKYKNERLEKPDATIEDVAAIALPEAASAMFVTTLTTAVAFFSTAICPVAPIRCFAVFLGLLVVFDYLLNIVLIFPALCIYDIYLSKSNRFIGCCLGLRCRGDRSVETDVEAASVHESQKGADSNSNSPVFIRRVLLSYYRFLHRTRWPLLSLCAAAVGITAFFASKLGLPETLDVRLLDESVQYEQNYMWMNELLSTSLTEIDRTHIVWGVQPADTGDHSDPTTSTAVVLDDTFDPSPEEAQVHLLEFCPRLLEQDFASAPRGFRCAIERFDDWLQVQSVAVDPDDAYVAKCSGASGLPMSSSSFHPCLTAWSRLTDETTILSRDERVLIVSIDFHSRVGEDSGLDNIGEEWELVEAYIDEKNRISPPSVSRAFFSSRTYLVYDSHIQMFATALGSGAIALGAAALVIFITSRSFVLTIFATASVAFVLTAVTSILVAMGWTLGYLECICFAVLIGVSVDFVIHFSHAYASQPGRVSRNERTKYALVHMGPSIIAGALTSMLSSVIMVFTTIIFFRKFAIVLLLTVGMAVFGSFVFFLLLTDCFGPSNPTRFVDQCVSKVLRQVGKGGLKTDKSPVSSE